MTAERPHPDLHELVDQLDPAQADAVRAVVLRLVTPDAAHDLADPHVATLPRTLAFVGAGASGTGITHRIDEMLADGFGRD